MDPFSIVALVGSCVKIAGGATTLVTDIHSLGQKYKNVEPAARLLAGQVSAIQIGVQRFSSWLDDHPPALSREDRIVLGRSLEDCDYLITHIHAHVSNITSSSGRPTFRSKVRYTWDETSIREYRESLQSQVQALHFSLDVIQKLPITSGQSLFDSSDSRQILEKARDDASEVLGSWDSEEGQGMLDLTEYSPSPDEIRKHTGPASGHSRGESCKTCCIGIDFGTTCSGVAWGLSTSHPEHINVVTKWDGDASLPDQVKVPTEISYRNGFPRWVYDLSPEEEPVKWFKLLLLHQEDMPEDVRSSSHILHARQMLSKYGKTAIEVISDYLRFLWSHAIDDMARALGQESILGLLFRVVVTVPATWPRYAQESMRKAVQAAGILTHRNSSPGETVLEIVPEPEAAALATFSDFRYESNIKCGDIYVICDAGGGTVDLISYEVRNVHPMAIEECVGGRGRLCGGVFLDQEFQKQIQMMLGGNNWEKLGTRSTKKIMMEWDYGIKRHFSNSDLGRIWNINLPTELLGRGLRESISGGIGNFFRPSSKKEGTSPIKGDVLRLNRKQIVMIFDPVISQIQDLVDDQVRSAQLKAFRRPKAILLVGGFGSCRYLYELLDARNAPKDIKVLQPQGDRPWSAVSRGAVMRAFTSLSSGSGDPAMRVSSRVSRFSYGFETRVPFVEGIHLPEDKMFGASEGQYFAMNQGADISRAESVRIPLVRLVQNALPQNRFSIKIYTCDKDKPPPRITRDVHLLCTVVCRVDTPFEDLPTFSKSETGVLRKLEFELEMKPSSASVEFFVYGNGKRQGRMETQWDQ
ncbi:MAG: hypothetical protein M1839_008639 [Geoglossum umbratile]|nr:MAG: hypothetical protein M1839_008639 [Geoglossum umbratile]